MRRSNYQKRRLSAHAMCEMLVGILLGVFGPVRSLSPRLARITVSVWCSHLYRPLARNDYCSSARRPHIWFTLRIWLLNNFMSRDYWVFRMVSIFAVYATCSVSFRSRTCWTQLYKYLASHETNRQLPESAALDYIRPLKHIYHIDLCLLKLLGHGFSNLPVFYHRFTLPSLAWLSCGIR